MTEELIITDESARSKLNFAAWRSAALPLLAELFSAFATVNKFAPSVATVSIGVTSLCTERKKGVFPELDPAKVRKARDEALRAAEAVVGADEVNLLFTSTLKRIQGLVDPLLAISGKDFVLPLIDWQMQSLGCRVKNRSLRIRLACCGRRERFSDLANVLQRAAKGWT